MEYRKLDFVDGVASDVKARSKGVSMFSVIIPAYNSEKTIGKALDSLIRQTRIDLIDEVIVVDDGSTDDTAKKVEMYQSRENNKENRAGVLIKLLRQENAGPSAARNTGMKQAVAEYIAFLDADDEWVSDKLECQAEILKENPQIDLLCGGMEEGTLRILFCKYSTLYHLSLKEYCFKSVIFTSTVVIRKQRLSEVGYFDESMRYCEDMNYYQRFFQWNQIYYLPKKLVDYAKNRAYYGQSGLSSHLKEMHQGRRCNFGILRKEKRISTGFYILMVLFGEMKYVRRKMLSSIGFLRQT